MKTYKRRPLAALFAVLVLLAGCAGPLHEDGPDSSGSGKGIVRISLAGSQARTLLPAADVFADLYYALCLTAPERAPVNSGPFSGLTAEVELEPGVWTLKVTGFATRDEAANPDAEPMASGSAELTVKPGGIIPVSVALSVEAKSGSGELDYNVLFPGEAESARLVLTPLSDGDTVEIDMLAEAETETLALAAGYYRLGLEVTLPSGESLFPRTARKTAIVHIYDGFTTPLAEVFGPEDFYDLPIFTAVEDLSAWLAAAPENTPEAPYQVILQGLNVETDFEASGGDPLGKLYAALKGKYVSLDLSGCTGASIKNSVNDVSSRGNKDGIVSLVLPKTLKTLGNYAFQNCVALVSLNWQSVETGATIGDRAFFGCQSLESVTLPAGLESIGNHAFQSCWSLGAIELPSTLQSIGNYAFSSTALVSLDWPAAAAAATIGDNAFLDCSSLTTVSLPSTLTSIGVSAFSGCPDLESLYLAPGITATINTQAFADSRNLTFYVDPADSVFTTCFSGKGLVQNTTLVAVIGAAGELSLPPGITEIAPYAFYDCANLTGITLPSNLTSIGDYAFAYAGLQEITLPSSLEIIGRNAFEYTGLIGIILPATVKTIGNYAFQNCAALESVSWSDAPVDATLGSQAFLRCEVLNSVVLPSTLTSIGAATFSNCGSLSEITLPASLITIDNIAFLNTTGLASITLPASLTTIGSRAFSGSGLTSITLPAALQTISFSAFQNCSNLRWIKWPSSAGDVVLANNVSGTAPFSGCTQLEKVELPDRLKEIQLSYFGNCPALEVVVLHATNPPILGNLNAFPVATNPNLRFYVPDETAVSAYKAADNWKSLGYINKIVEIISTINPDTW
jgi:hypothetical protein